MVLIYTTLSNSPGLFESARPVRGPAFSGLAAFRWPILVSAIVIAWPLAQLTASLDEQPALGHFSGLAVVCVVLLRGDAARAALDVRVDVREPFPTTGVALLCAASAICVQFDPIGDQNIFPGSSTIEWFGLDLNTRLLLLALCCLGAAESVAVPAVPAIARGAVALAAAGAAECRAFGIQRPDDALWWGYFATTMIATSTFAAVAMTARLSTVSTASASRSAAEIL